MYVQQELHIIIIIIIPFQSQSKEYWESIQ